MTETSTSTAPVFSPEELAALEASIAACVRDFYVSARGDDLLGPVFNHVIRDWDGHLKTMDDFWSGALLGTQRYQAAPFPPHVKLEMSQDHFDRWRELWSASAQACLPEPIRGKALSIGEHMAHCWGRAYVTLRGQMAQA